MEEKKYINIDNMATRLCQILKDARESMVDDKNKDFIMENFSDKHLEDKSNEMAWQFNSDMKKYLHNPDHRICGNFNNIDYDYPYHIYGEVTYDTPLVNAMIARLDAGEDSEQANKDRNFLGSSSNLVVISFFISTVFFFLNPIKSCRYVCFLVTLKTPHH